MPASALDTQTLSKQSDGQPGAGAGAPAKRQANLLFVLAQAAIYLVAALIFLEAFFYIARVGDSEHIMPDLQVGFKPFAGKRITQRGEGFGCFHLNSFGMQNDEISVAKPPGVYRIAVFGDSYVEALQVPRSANYITILAEQLSKKLGRKVQVLNFGVSNYSVAQDFLRYQTVARQFKPDMVIQVFRVEEVGKLLPMETRALLFVRPVFMVDEHGKLVYDNFCVREYFQTKEGRRMLATQWLRQYSRIWGVIGGLWQQALTFQTSACNNLTPKKAAPSFTLPSDQTRSNYAKCYWYIMDKQLSAFKDQCTADGAKFVFLRTPMIRPGMHVLTDNETETGLLQKTASKLNVPVLNLDQAYRKWAGTKDDGTNFSSGGHFTARLHSWVADNVAPFLASYISQAKTDAANSASEDKSTVKKSDNKLP